MQSIQFQVKDGQDPLTNADIQDYLQLDKPYKSIGPYWIFQSSLQKTRHVYQVLYFGVAIESPKLKHLLQDFCTKVGPSEVSSVALKFQRLFVNVLAMVKGHLVGVVVLAIETMKAQAPLGLRDLKTL